MEATTKMAPACHPHAGAKPHLTQSPKPVEDASKNAASTEGCEPAIRRAGLDVCIDHGFALIPLNGKRPRDREWTRREYDPRETVREALADSGNVGVRLTERDLVLDVDPRNGGSESLAELRAYLAIFDVDLDSLPRVRTGSGGFHFYMRKPAGVSVLKNVRGLPGLDFLSAGHQVVAPGSIHPETGQPYVWEVPPGPQGIPEAPEVLVDRARRPEGKSANSDGEKRFHLKQVLAMFEDDILDPNDPRVREYGDWLQTGMAAHYETDGDPDVREAWVEWSCRQDGYAGHEDACREKWATFGHDPAAKPVTGAYLAKLCDGRVPPGPAEDDFTVVEEPPFGQAERTKRPRFRLLSLEDLAALPPPRWLVKGLLPQNALAALYGMPGVGKSFLAVDLAMSVGSGVGWQGRRVEEGTVVYVAAEGHAGMRKRTQAWRAVHQVEGTLPFYVIDSAVNLTVDADVDVLLAEVRALGQLAMVVIDTLNRCSAGAEENSATEMGRFVRGCDRIREATGATVLVVHHSGKEPGRGMRGSTALLGAMDSVLALERMRDGPSVELRVEKQKDAEPSAPIGLSPETVKLPWEEDGGPATSLVFGVVRETVPSTAEDDFAGQPRGKDEPLALIARSVMDAGGRLGVKDVRPVIMQALGRSGRTADRWIANHLREGRRLAMKVGTTSVWLEREGTHSSAPLFVCAEDYP
jgi:KaiC/GvpD/RAD55 family RecA-like ATPase